MKRLIALSLLALCATFSALAQPASDTPASSPADTSAKREKVYLAVIAEDVACPAGSVGIRMRWQASPFFNPEHQLRGQPAPVTGCLVLDGQALPKSPVVAVTFDGKDYHLSPR